MKFEKRNFMGIELDVLVGHPEHDLLFVANQVARAAGLKDPKGSVTQRKEAAKALGHGLQIQELKSLVEDFTTLKPPAATNNRWGLSWLFNESAVYTMLLRGHAPASEPFRKWVTEEVLPTCKSPLLHLLAL